jgi:hypothetical protein
MALLWPEVNDMFFPKITLIGLFPVLVLSRNVLTESKVSAMAQNSSYRMAKVDSLSNFYRETGYAIGRIEK